MTAPGKTAGWHCGSETFPTRHVAWLGSYRQRRAAVTSQLFRGRTKCHTEPLGSSGGERTAGRWLPGQTAPGGGRGESVDRSAGGRGCPSPSAFCTRTLAKRGASFKNSNRHPQHERRFLCRQTGRVPGRPASLSPRRAPPSRRRVPQSRGAGLCSHRVPSRPHPLDTPHVLLQSQERSRMWRRFGPGSIASRTREAEA